MTAICKHCGRDLPPREGPGQPRRWCNATCRNAAYRDRNRPRPKPALELPAVVSPLLSGLEGKAQLEAFVAIIRALPSQLGRLTADLDGGERLLAWRYALAMEEACDIVDSIDDD